MLLAQTELAPSLPCKFRLKMSLRSAASFCSLEQECLQLREKRSENPLSMITHKKAHHACASIINASLFTSAVQQKVKFAVSIGRMRILSQFLPRLQLIDATQSLRYFLATKCSIRALYSSVSLQHLSIAMCYDDGEACATFSSFVVCEPRANGRIRID